MSIYPSNYVYGITMYKLRHNIFDEYCEVFKICYDKIMTQKMINDVKKFYDNLSQKDKKDLKFSVYTKCSSSYNKGTFMTWYPMSEDEFFKFIEKI